MIVLITGANRGLGKEVATQLAEKGHEIIMTARDEQKGIQALKEVRERSGNDNVRFIQLDVGSEEDCKRVFKIVNDNYDHLDVLINNAGIFLNADDSSHVSMDVMEYTMKTNFLGPFRLSQLFLPILEKAEDPRIINVSSGMGALTDMGSGYAAYRISKTALNSLTAVMAADLHLRGLKVFSVCPGWVKTDMGGKEAPRELQEGAWSIMWLIDSPEAISGKFYRDGKQLSW